ncbi:MAG TPA: bile acid:sodium symporter [Verrucomicrobiae bacterium]|nr:bile acid:sodium symporter [Verrucomicrobiae bacterium]
MGLNADTAIRVLTMTSLGGLLFTTGLRLTWLEIVNALRASRFGWILLVNFALVPALTFCVAHVFQFPSNIAIGMMLLAAAPFAPVVPVFTKMARGDMALAGALTALFPLLSAFLTPLVCEFALKPWLGTGPLKFNVLTILVVLVSTITLPLVIGVMFSHWVPALGRKLLRPCEIFSEAAGALSLAFVSFVEFPAVRETGWKPLLAMAVVFELCLAIGYFLGGSSAGARRVVALGTSNRNIALALLVGIESFPGTPILAGVVANGLLLIFLGLLHVAYWRFWAEDSHEKAQKARK